MREHPYRGGDSTKLGEEKVRSGHGNSRKAAQMSARKQECARSTFSRSLKCLDWKKETNWAVLESIR